MPNELKLNVSKAVKTFCLDVFGILFLFEQIYLAIN